MYRLGPIILLALTGAVCLLPLLLNAPGAPVNLPPPPPSPPAPAPADAAEPAPSDAATLDVPSSTPRAADVRDGSIDVDTHAPRRHAASRPKVRPLPRQPALEIPTLPPATAPATRTATRPAAPAEFDRSQAARARGVQRFGGTPQTENAVEAGLVWLATHQSPEGLWDRFRFPELDPPGDRCTGVAIRRTESSIDAGLTGLCVLAFLGAGYTDREGPFQDTIRHGVEALLAQQQRHGGFGADERMAGYNDALATFALAEFHVMTGDPRVVAPLRAAVRRLARSQQALGGWDYGPWPNTGRNDTSITAWAVQALHACAAAAVAPPPQTLLHATLHFVRAAEPDGKVRYSDAGTGFALDARRLPSYRYGPAMLAAGLTCEQLLGWRMDGPLPQRQAALLLADPPSPSKFHGRDRSELHSENYWYYGTVAMFQRGGTDWERWNARLRDALLPLQNRDKHGERKRAAYGSWDPYGERWGKWGEIGSRIYTTAICVLTLEVYYRHTPGYLTNEPLLGPQTWSEFLADASSRQRRDAVEYLRQARCELGEPVLAILLADPDSSVALAAAEGLVDLDSPLGLPVLERLVSRLPPWGRGLSDRALQRARALAKLPPPQGRLRVFDQARGLATLDLPGAYVGLLVAVQRDGREIARLRIVQRYSNEPLAVGELSAPAAEPPRAGDPAVGVPGAEPESGRA